MCPKHLPLNTDVAKASASSSGFRAALWCQESQQMWAEPSRNVPGNLSALFFLSGIINRGMQQEKGGGGALMRTFKHLTESRCSLFCCNSVPSDNRVPLWIHTSQEHKERRAKQGLDFVCKMFIEWHYCCDTNKIEHIYKYIIYL